MDLYLFENTVVFYNTEYILRTSQCSSDPFHLNLLWELHWKLSSSLTFNFISIHVCAFLGFDSHNLQWSGLVYIPWFFSYFIAITIPSSSFRKKYQILIASFHKHCSFLCHFYSRRMWERNKQTIPICKSYSMLFVCLKFRLFTLPNWRVIPRTAKFASYGSLIWLWFFPGSPPDSFTYCAEIKF